LENWLNGFAPVEHSAPPRKDIAGRFVGYYLIVWNESQKKNKGIRRMYSDDKFTEIKKETLRVEL
jgi:hypothetical protein